MESRPHLPPQAPVSSVSIGGIEGSDLRHLNRRQAQATITIPPDAPAGPYKLVTLVFPGPPFEPERTVAYTLPGGFTIK